MITCLLFDLDGTLFDSTAANVAAYAAAFKDVGVTFDATAYKRLFGLRFDEMMAAIAPDMDAATRQKIKPLKAGYYEANFDLVRQNTGLLALLRSCRAHYKTALVTTAARRNVTSLLRHFAVEETLFDVIITGDEVTHGKPDPECYLAAIKALGVPAEQCCVFEDSDIGITAARAAGADVIRVQL